MAFKPFLLGFETGDGIDNFVTKRLGSNRSFWDLKRLGGGEEPGRGAKRSNRSFWDLKRLIESGRRLGSWDVQTVPSGI